MGVTELSEKGNVLKILPSQLNYVENFPSLFSCPEGLKHYRGSVAEFCGAENLSEGIYTPGVEIELQVYIIKRKELDPDPEAQTLFDFLYLTGARISEALNRTTPQHFNWAQKTVSIRTLKHPKHPMREVFLFPDNDHTTGMIEQLRAYVDEKNPDEKLWTLAERAQPRQLAWVLAKRHFGTKPHSFRHTHAIQLVRDLRLNMHELQYQMGWSDMNSSQAYVQYSFADSIAQRIRERAAVRQPLVAAREEPDEASLLPLD